jgi:hypothetical protein
LQAEVVKDVERLAGERINQAASVLVNALHKQLDLSRNTHHVVENHVVVATVHITKVWLPSAPSVGEELSHVFEIVDPQFAVDQTIYKLALHFLELVLFEDPVILHDKGCLVLDAYGLEVPRVGLVFSQGNLNDLFAHQKDVLLELFAVHVKLANYEVDHFLIDVLTPVLVLHVCFYVN